MKSITLTLLFAILAQPTFSQDILLIRGQVLTEQLAPLPKTSRLRVYAVSDSSPTIVQAVVDDNRYELKIPLQLTQIAGIWTIEFHAIGRHPGSVDEIAGSPSTHEIDKVLLPEDGPRNYQRNIDQLLEYERLWYDRIARGESPERLRQFYRAKLVQMPTIHSRQSIPEIFGGTKLAKLKRDLLWQKRWEVFQLYGVRLPERPGPSGAGVCCD